MEFFQLFVSPNMRLHVDLLVPTVRLIFVVFFNPFTFSIQFPFSILTLFPSLAFYFLLPHWSHLLLLLSFNFWIFIPISILISYIIALKTCIGHGEFNHSTNLNSSETSLDFANSRFFRYKQAPNPRPINPTEVKAH